MLADTPTDVQAAREALAATEAPPRVMHLWRFVCASCGLLVTEDGPTERDTAPPEWVARNQCADCVGEGCPVRDAGSVEHETWDDEPDQTVDAAHLRAALAHLDALTARLAVVEGEREACEATIQQEKART